MPWSHLLAIHASSQKAGNGARGFIIQQALPQVGADLARPDALRAPPGQ